MTRRESLKFLLAAGIWTLLKGRLDAAQPSSMKDIENLQKNWKALLAEGTKLPLPSEPLKLSKEEWRKRLDPTQFNILREEGTEPPGTSPLNNEKRPGVFVCVGCNLAALYLRHEIRERHRMAEFLHHDTRCIRQQNGLQVDPAAQRISLYPLRRPPRPRLRRRPATHREALVQQRCRLAVYPS